MKKIISILLVAVFAFSINVSAYNEELDVASLNDGVYEYFDDGSYLVTTFESVESQYNMNAKATGDYTVTGKKSATYYNSDDEVLWQVTVTGVFLIVPSDVNRSGYCQSSKLTYVINSSTWHISNIVEQEITNNACVSCTMKRKFLGITTNTVDVDLHIVCDAYGNMS